MNTSPSRQPKNTSQPQRLPYHKKEHSQTTIDLYLKPVKKDGRGQNDIRNYFLPIAKGRVIPNGESKKADSREEMRATSITGHDGNSGNEFQMSGPRPDVKTPVGNKTSIPISPQPRRETPAIPVRPRTHKYANSEVLPKFDAFFDSKDFPHSTSPMAPRVTDVARHSLVPKPLNIRLPPPPVETSRSPSVTTSSPSSVEDSDDAASLDEEEDGENRRGAPSFKQTYSRVHSRHNTNDEPISPLVALRDPSSKRPLRQRTERPKTLRSKTVPLFSEGGHADGDSVIYFLPKISPTEESSADEGTPLGMSGWESSVEKGKPERLDGRFEDVGPAQGDLKREGMKQTELKVSPGLQRYYDYLASQKNTLPTKGKGRDKGISDGNRKEEEIPLLDRTGTGSSVKREKKKKRGFLRLIEAYSKHVEGLQMIQ